MVLLLGRTSSEVFCDVCCSFIFVASFCCCCSSCIASYVMLFFIHCFKTSSLTLLWTIAGFLHPFYTFSPAYRRVIRDTFILAFPRSFMVLLRAYSFQWAFFTHRCFLPYSPSPTFSYVYQGLPGSWQFFLEVCRASY